MVISEEQLSEGYEKFDKMFQSVTKVESRKYRQAVYNYGCLLQLQAEKTDMVLADRLDFMEACLGVERRRRY